MTSCVPNRVHEAGGTAVTGVGIEPTTYGLKDSRQAEPPRGASPAAEGGEDTTTRGTPLSDVGVRASLCPPLPLTGSVAVRLTALAIAQLAVDETLRRVAGSPRCACGHARARHRQANWMPHERGACTQCGCAQYAPGATA